MSNQEQEAAQNHIQAMLHLVSNKSKEADNEMARHVIILFGVMLRDLNRIAKAVEHIHENTRRQDTIGAYDRMVR